MDIGTPTEKADFTHYEGSDQEKAGSETNLKLDKFGLPLVPQPTDSLEDPLNWPTWYKNYVLGLICLVSFALQFCAGMIPSSFRPIAASLKVTQTQASYLTTGNTLLGGLTPFLFLPYVDVFGRRPFFIAGGLLTVAANIGSAFAPGYASLVACRCIAGSGASFALAFGAATITDMHFQKDRGFYIGLYALAVTNGPHFGPIAGGYISTSKHLGWRWIFKVTAILLGGITFLFIFTFPETLYSRTPERNIEKHTYFTRMFARGKVVKRDVKLKEFGRQWNMLKYLAVLLPCIYYATANTFGSIFFVLSASQMTTKLYDFDARENGLFIGIPLTLGCLVGESFSGWVSDRLVTQHAKKNGGHRVPEKRLALAFVALLIPVGIIIEGVCAGHKTHWIGPAAGMFIASIGTQAGTTLVYSYCCDCYKPQAPEVAAMINLARQLLAFTCGFYANPLAAKLGYSKAWAVFACVQLATWFCLVPLMLNGEAIREKQGYPAWHRDL